MLLWFVGAVAGILTFMVSAFEHFASASFVLNMSSARGQPSHNEYF